MDIDEHCIDGQASTKRKLAISVQNGTQNCPAKQPKLNDSDTTHVMFDSFTKKNVNARKRIYGDEYIEPTVLNVKPQAKLVKLEQPMYYELGGNTPTFVNANDDKLNKHKLNTTCQQATLSASTTSPAHSTAYHLVDDPIPTVTQRQYIRKQFSLHHVRHICSKCYSLDCICSIIYKDFK